MHELSIAEAVADIALRHARGRQVTAVHLEVGHLRQVVPSALEFAFELVAAGTPLEGAELQIEEVPAEGRCRACREVTALPGFPLACGSCGGLEVDVIRGDELRVDSLDLEERQSRCAPGNARCLRTTATTGG